jgi:benzoyl-CoA reductase/2-hydroxyglutaryl-CoA dehydratase subunit BcrC/BadD/HgdB
MKSLNEAAGIIKGSMESMMDGSGSGERTWPAKFDRRRLREKPLLTLAEAYFGAISDAFRRPNSELYRWLEIELSKRGVKGIIYRRHVWCDTWNAELGRLRDWTELPVLDLEVESSGLRNETRIQAFLEALR